MGKRKIKVVLIGKIVSILLTILSTILFGLMFFFLFYKPELQYLATVFGAIAYLLTIIFLVVLAKVASLVNDSLKEATDAMDEQVKDFANRIISYNSHESAIEPLDNLRDRMNETFKSFSRYNISLTPESYTYDATRYIKAHKVISKEDFARLVPIEIERNQSYRFACLSIRAIAKEFTPDTMNLLKDKIIEIFGDCLISLYDKDVYQVLLYNVDSIPILRLTLQELSRLFYEIVVHKDDDINCINYINIGASLFPQSSAQSIIKDSLKALNTCNGEEAIKIFSPTSIPFQNRYIKTEEIKARIYAEHIFSFENDISKAKTTEERTLVCRNNLISFAYMFGFTSSGLLKYDELNNTYKCMLDNKLSPEYVSFSDFLVMPNREIDLIYKFSTEDSSFYGNVLHNLPPELSLLFKKLNINNYFFFRISLGGKKIGLLYFINTKNNAINKEITFTEYTSLFVYAFIFKVIYVSSLSERKAAFLEDAFSNVLERDNSYVYCVDNNTHRISYISDNLKRAFPNAEVGSVCYKVLRHHHDAPCSHCPILFSSDNRIISAISDQPMKLSILSYKGLNEGQTSIIIEKSDFACDIDEPDSIMDQTFHIYNSKALALNFSKQLKSGVPGYIVAIRLCNLQERLKEFGKEPLDACITLLLRRLAITGKTKSMYMYDVSTYTILCLLRGFNMVETYDFIEDLSSYTTDPIIFDGKEKRLEFNFLIGSYPSSIASLGDLDRAVALGLKKLMETNLTYVSQVLGEREKRSTLREQYILDLLKENSSKDIVEIAIQPIMKNKDDIVAGECLARLSDKLRGPISPVEFVPIASKNHLMFNYEMGVLRSIGDIYSKHYNDLFRIAGLNSLHINLSIDALLSDNLVSTIKDIFRRYQFSKGFIAFEINIELLIKNLEKVNSIYNELSRLGIDFIIDNVCNVQSLELVSQSQIKSIKIDRSVAKEIVESGYNELSEFYRITTYAARKGYSVSIEGIETNEQYDIAIKEGIKDFQGYYFSKPLDITKFIEFLHYSK